MDFFATGGFQQLFSDLDEHVIENDFQALTTDCDTPVLADEDTMQQFEQTLSAELRTAEKLNENTDFLDNQKQHFYYELVKVEKTFNCALQNQLEDANKHDDIVMVSTDWNNNSYHHDTNELHLNDKQLQYSLDLLLPITPEDGTSQAESTDFATDYLITREMTDWEERFLDNYIEIPELIDFLPEKTPLCTDECELFLQESTKNLRLHRKRKQAANCENSRTGYTCTFGDCRKIYAKPAHLKAHLRRHLGEKPYVCNWPNCTWRFSRSDELARHRRSHSGVKPYKCDYCTKCFARSDHLTKHRKVHERRLLAASRAGKVFDASDLPYSILTVRPGRKRKNQL